MNVNLIVDNSRKLSQNVSRDIPTIPDWSLFMNSFIEQAKVMPKGQITIPKEIRDLLNLKVGDRVSFIVDGQNVIFANSSVCALKLIQNAMEGEALKAGIKDDDDDVQALINEIRR